MLSSASGTDAVLGASMAIGIGPGDEVVTSTYSFFATAGCVARLGARPVLVDIDPATFNIDTAAAVAAITLRTRALLPVHLFGQSADLMPLINAGVRHGIPIVENRPLARTLDAEVSVGNPVKIEHFAAVAKILAFVFRLKRKRT